MVRTWSASILLCSTFCSSFCEFSQQPHSFGLSLAVTTPPFPSHAMLGTFLLRWISTPRFSSLNRTEVGPFVLARLLLLLLTLAALAALAFACRRALSTYICTSLEPVRPLASPHCFPNIDKPLDTVCIQHLVAFWTWSRPIATAQLAVPPLPAPSPPLHRAGHCVVAIATTET
ncbi:hypothetical protein DE146DRAFT_515467 [Phaeosphaeria sp. MPI-PUGE-AT-0046c]|nr:hypothetical protein DE146DRAFT_515467 [Phaeosphaeria sp. MPI-PUGE-AT-0046c]